MIRSAGGCSWDERARGGGLGVSPPPHKKKERKERKDHHQQITNTPPTPCQHNIKTSTADHHHIASISLGHRHRIAKASSFLIGTSQSANGIFNADIIVYLAQAATTTTTTTAQAYTRVTTQLGCVILLRFTLDETDYHNLNTQTLFNY